VEVEKVLYDDLVRGNQGETSAQIRERILMAREIQRARFASLDITTNSQIKMQYIEEYCTLTKRQKEMMEQAYGKLGLTARSYHKVLCVARTIADLAESSSIANKHLREALAFRMFQWFQEDRL
jgi:magnesium chelatase family protein